MKNKNEYNMKLPMSLTQDNYYHHLHIFAKIKRYIAGFLKGIATILFQYSFPILKFTLLK